MLLPTLRVSRLAAATGFFIPSAPLVLDMLQWSELRKAPTGGKAGTVPDMSLQLRVGKTVLRNAAFQEEVVQQVSSEKDTRQSSPYTESAVKVH